MSLFLNQDLEEKLELWMEKYDKDIEGKQNELISLKASKTSNLQRLREDSEKVFLMVQDTPTWTRTLLTCFPCTLGVFLCMSNN